MTSLDLKNVGSSTTLDRSSAYVGTELPLFAKATNWKAYFSSALQKYIHGSVLEVGAGFGATTPFLFTPRVQCWTALEPDPRLACEISAHLKEACCPIETKIVVGTLQALPHNSRFDCITYIDVLEHIKEDTEELGKAASLLADGGHLVVLSPAYQCLYSKFDAAVGHYRRYTRASLRAIGPPSLEAVSFFYLDSVGVAASLANRAFLRQSSPTGSQIEFWDRKMVPISRWIDPFFSNVCGRSVVGIWRKSSDP